MKTTILMAAVAPLMASAAFALDPPAGEKTPSCTESVTVFQDVAMMGRKDRTAANITRRHREMAEQHWRFVDMEVYTENSDLEGIFLTYSRTRPCP